MDTFTGKCDECGNSLEEYGFWPCDENGKVADDIQDPASDYRRCIQCDKVFVKQSKAEGEKA